MLKKYTIEYSLQFRKHATAERHTFYTDDPLVCESFLQQLLERGMGIHVIRHDGVELAQADFDRMVKVAASTIAGRLVATSLNLKNDEVNHRFGFTA
jgi:uncharacterized protein YabE (DUF348 family)